MARKMDEAKAERDRYINEIMDAIGCSEDRLQAVYKKLEHVSYDLLVDLMIAITNKSPDVQQKKCDRCFTSIPNGDRYISIGSQVSIFDGFTETPITAHEELVLCTKCSNKPPTQLGTLDVGTMVANAKGGL